MIRGSDGSRLRTSSSGRVRGTSAYKPPVTYRKSSTGMVRGSDGSRCRTSSSGRVRCN